MPSEEERPDETNSVCKGQERVLGRPSRAEQVSTPHHLPKRESSVSMRVVPRTRTTQVPMKDTLYSHDEAVVPYGQCPRKIRDKVLLRG